MVDTKPVKVSGETTATYFDKPSRRGQVEERRKCCIGEHVGHKLAALSRCNAEVACVIWDHVVAGSNPVA